MRNLLVYNIMEFPEKIRLFNDGISVALEGTGIDAEFYVFGKSAKLPSYQDFTHLIISGSEASAMDESAWTEELTQLIHDFADAGKKILAICYGHQFLVRALCGKEHVYKLPVPEYGYSKIRLKANKLFKGISDPVVLELHYDAVRDLPGEFEIIAKNDTSIQAFQYNGRDIFGVQFHPEFDAAAAEYFFEEAREADPGFPSFFKNELTEIKILEQNRLFIRNFLEL